MQFQEQYDVWLAQIEKALPAYLPEVKPQSGGRASQAARYSLLAGGKRIRPVLALATAAMLRIDLYRVMPYACAIEMIHTYSLIHDDLPCMDDDTMRRGQPTCHVVFGEAAAVLAGDLLLNRAYEIMLQAIDPVDISSLQAARIIAATAGGNGMIGGQMLDLLAEGRNIPLRELEKLHSLKTGALLKAPVLCAAVLADVRQEVYTCLENFAELTGLAFQIRDDILDATADSGVLGKSAGKDARDGKSTYVSIMGLAAAREKQIQIGAQIRDSLQWLRESAGYDPDFLEQMTDYLLSREK